MICHNVSFNNGYELKASYFHTSVSQQSWKAFYICTASVAFHVSDDIVVIPEAPVPSPSVLCFYVGFGKVEERTCWFEN